MKERIEEFLKKENKTYIQFANEIGVQPSSISHILSGRNKPSLDFVIKMLTRYKYISPSWLLFGKGEMYNESMPSLFRDEIQKEDKIQTAQDIKPEGHDLNDKVNQKDKNYLTALKNGSRKPASRIIIFYDDNTFDEYFPE